MTKKSDAPAIRFKGFSDAWEQRKLGEIGSVSMCRRIFKEQTSETGDIPFYKIGTFGAEPDAFISRELFEEYKSKYPYPKKGDILISASGSIGRTVEFAGNNEYFQDSNIVWLSHDESLSNSFLKCFYSVVKWAGIEGSTIKRLYNDNILNTVICMPSVPEQEHIGLFFENLDNLITLHQRQPFLHSTPEISLTVQLIHPFYTSSWEQRKFSDITFPAGEKNRDNLPLESYSITNEHGFVPQDEKFENGGTMREADKRMYYIVSPNSFAYNPARINVGSIGYQNIGKNVIVSSLFEVFKTSEDVDDRLLWHWFKSPDFQKLIMQLQEGGVRLYFYYDKLCMGEVSLPSLEEQRKIGKLFDTLDNLITLHQRKCALLFSLFQALISMMFTTSTFSWEQRKLGELALFNPKDELPRTFEYVDLESVVGTEMLSHRTEVKSSAPSRAQRLAHTGDLFYQTVRPYQKNNYLFEKPDNNYVFSTGYAQMRPYVDGYFLLSLVQSERFVKVVLDNCTGTSYPAINANDLAEIEVAAPSDESEAQKIGTIFRCIDNLITLHQRKPFLMKWRNSDANRNQTNRLVL